MGVWTGGIAAAWQRLRRPFHHERSSRTFFRDHAAEAFRRAGVHEALRRRGLVLWNVARMPMPDGGEQIILSLSLPSLDRIVEPYELPLRRRTLADVVSREREWLERLLADALGVPTRSAYLDQRLIETCCRRDCRSCLLNLPKQSQPEWTAVSADFQEIAQ